MTTHSIAAMAAKTADAYSFGRYGAEAWASNVMWLFDRGLSPEAVEAVMRSKWTRWAADHAGDEDLHNALRNYLTKPGWKAEAEAMAAE